MTYPLYSFTGASSPDQTSQAGYNQYIQQGQQGISPGQAQVAASNPISAAGISNLGKILGQQPPSLLAQQLPPDIAQQAMDQGAQMNPNVNGQNMGGVGPTQANLALANALQASQQQPGISQTIQSPFNFGAGSGY